MSAGNHRRTLLKLPLQLYNLHSGLLKLLLQLCSLCVPRASVASISFATPPGPRLSARTPPPARAVTSMLLPSTGRAVASERTQPRQVEEEEEEEGEGHGRI